MQDFGFLITEDQIKLIDESYRSFNYFDSTHITLIAIAAIIITASVLIFRRMGNEGKTKFLSVITVLLLLDELAKYAIAFMANSWSWRYLPLHLCSINIFVCLIYTITKKKFFAEILYCLCLPGAIIAMLVPSWNILPIFSAMHLHSANVHIMLALYPILLLSNGFRPNFRHLPKILPLLLTVCVPIYFINKWLGTNFFFLSETAGNPVLEMLASILGENYFFLGLPVLLAVVWVLLYLPWVIAKRKAKYKLQPPIK